MKNPKKGEFVVYYSARIGAPTLRLVGTIKEVVGRKCFVEFKSGERYCLDRTNLVRTSYPPKKEPPTPRTRWTLEHSPLISDRRLLTAPSLSIVEKYHKNRKLPCKRITWREVLEK